MMRKITIFRWGYKPTNMSLGCPILWDIEVSPKSWGLPPIHPSHSIIFVLKAMVLGISPFQETYIFSNHSHGIPGPIGQSPSAK